MASNHQQQLPQQLPPMQLPPQQLPQQLTPQPPPQSQQNHHPQPQFNPATTFGMPQASQGAPSGDGFDIVTWYPRYQNCQRYFLDNAQHSVPVQGLSAYLNIRLPFQRQSYPIFQSTPATYPGHQPPAFLTPPSVSLIPYLRRLVATGMDFPGVLHGFFGDDWGSGVGPLHEQERRNYMFAAKSGGWALVKQTYDIQPQETIPFLRPLQGTLTPEIEAAERSWSEWLAIEDWMVGPRAPDLDSSSQASHRRSSG